MNSFNSRDTRKFGNKEYTYYSLKKLSEGNKVKKLPYSLKILLENLLRCEDGIDTRKEHIEAVLNWNPKQKSENEIAFMPARVILQDFTGVPCVVDLASMRDAMKELGGDPAKINPLLPVELVIDHSVQVDAYGKEAALQINLDLEFKRNQERYEFLRWGQTAFDNFKVVPPNTGIVHQVNLEHLARVVFVNDEKNTLYPDTLVGTDSHTTMINGLGVLGWGVGGIEAEAAMLGQSISMLVPEVVGFKLSGKLPEGATATDLVLTITEMLRKHGVVGKFVEFYGEGLANLPLADRATIANMAPEYGATCGIFPVDEESLKYLEITGRDKDHIQVVREYLEAQGLFGSSVDDAVEYSSNLSLDLSTVEPSVAGPKRPQDRLTLGMARKSFTAAFPDAAEKLDESKKTSTATLTKDADLQVSDMEDGSVVIAAITSCTNTSNPSVMLAAGLVAKKAREKGIQTKPWVKTSLAPGSLVAKKYLEQANLLGDMNALGFNVVGYGCTTCIGNSGPLPDEVSKEVQERNLVAVSVLSGNRNFEGRVNPEVKANYLMSPPLVVAYALAGTINIDISKDAIAHDKDGNPVYLRDIWPTQKEVADTVASCISREMYEDAYADVFKGDEKWQNIPVTESNLFDWKDVSTYIRRAPFFDNMEKDAPESVENISGMRMLAKLGDSITTDHISPAGSIKLNSPGGKYLTDNGFQPAMFNSYGSRRGNHEIMMRGTFANIRLRNQLAPGTEGGFTTHMPSGEVTSIYDAAMRYQEENVPLIVVAGKEYGTGSSRDWAAKGSALLGVKVVIAESFERIHRSNLVGMGILPLQFLPGDSAESLGLNGNQTFSIKNFKDQFESGNVSGKKVAIEVKEAGKQSKSFDAIIRIDTPGEMQYYRHGGILQYVLRNMMK